MLPKQSVVGLYLASVSVLLICVSSLALGQTASPAPPKVMAPHQPIPPRFAKPVKWLTPAMSRSMIGGLWMTDANFKSAIYIRNIVETDPITVTPILHLSNGVKYTLPNVTVQPAGIAVIDINQGLQQQGIASYSTLSGYAELQYTWPWDPFCVTIRNVDVAHSLIFTYGLQPTLPPPIQLVTPLSRTPRQMIEGMWWKHEANVTGFVALANISSQPVQANVEVTDNLANIIAQHNVTVSPQGMKLVNLDELLSSTSVQGGILITSSATTDNLIVNGALEDQAVGYSADLSFATDAVSSSGPTPETIAELGLMAGAADPMMSFPAGTTFTPYSELRNVSDAPLSITPTLWWMAAGSAQSAQLPLVSIQPHQTLGLDVMSLLAQAGLISASKTFNGSFNLVFSANMNTGALLLAAGSVDQTNTYVFEVIPRGVAEGGSKSLQYWSTGNGDDTMVNMWNPADEAQDFVVTLFFGLPDGTQGHYLWPLHLEPRAARTFNVSQIIQNQIPDSEGNIIPAVVHEGGIKIAGSQAENEHILLAVDSGIYNVRKATCGPGCQVCNGYTGAGLLANPSIVAVQSTNQLYFIGTWGTGGQYQLPGSWYSYQPSIATVGVSSGVASGVSPGSALVYSESSPNQPVEVTPFCGGGGCPTTAFFAEAPANVVQVQVTGADIENNDVDVTLTGPSGLSGTLTIIVNGSPNNAPSFLASGGAALGAGQYRVPMNRPGLLSADTYTSTTADWDVGGGVFPNTLTLSRKWIVRGTIRHSQYNTVYESACPTTTQTAYLYTGSGGSCSWQTVTLRSQYVSQNEINGTGVSQNYGVLKYDDGRCAGSYPSGANSSNSLLKVSSVTGQCNTTLIGGDSVATNPGPFYSNPYGCVDNLELVNSSNQNAYLKHVADQCANTSQGCADGHMDNYSSTQACSGRAVGDLPGSPYWTVDDQ